MTFGFGLLSQVGHFEMYVDRVNEWRWRFWKNGNVIADSAEGYRNKADCRRGIEIMQASANAPVRD